MMLFPPFKYTKLVPASEPSYLLYPLFGELALHSLQWPRSLASQLKCHLLTAAFLHPVSKAYLPHFALSHTVVYHTDYPPKIILFI